MVGAPPFPAPPEPQPTAAAADTGKPLDRAAAALSHSLGSLRQQALWLALLWTLAVAGSLLWNRTLLQEGVLDEARNQAQAAINKDLNYRALITRLGGVYAATDRGVEPSPHLADIPERDVVTASGRTLTLVNSSYFMRLVHDEELQGSHAGIRGHTTSLRPLHPGNAPDAWEREGLLAFGAGAERWQSVLQEQDGPTYRLMAPRMATEACLECHSRQDYQVGEVLGGISVRISLAPLYADAHQRLLVLGAGHAFLWLLGLGGLQFGHRLLQGQERVLRWAAYYDALTGLPNRSLLHDRLEQALARARRHGGQGALCYLDLDRFKTINDSLGHGVGDGLLKEVARTLQGALRDEDTVARIGGDEFVVLVGGLDAGDGPAVHQAQHVATKILRALSRPYRVNGHDLHAPVSMGITLFPGSAASADDLLRQADTAMYRAKEGGGDGYRFYRPEMQEAADRRLQLETDLRCALEQEQFELHYQPQLEMADNRIVGAEALLRWRHPRRGLLGPEAFMAVAEETGLILPIGDWTLRTACRQLGALSDEAPLRIAVNVSPFQFQHPDFVPRLCAIMEEAEMAPERLVLELTEGALIRNLEATADKLRELERLGVELCVDDFGAGHSSLAYLRQLPVRTLKIDATFVGNLPGSADDVAIAETIIAMAWRFRLRVVAEGVETQAQLEFLKARGCDAYQGYLFSPAVTAESFRALLATTAA